MEHKHHFEQGPDLTIDQKIELVKKQQMARATNNQYSKHPYRPSELYKAICIDFFINRYKCQIITSEFRYGISQCVTDLVIITPRNIISIEVKTEQDDLRRLRTQIEEARKNFNLTIVFAANRFKDELLTMLPQDVGITLFGNEHCEVLRAPKRNKPNEMELVASIPAIFLRSYFKLTNDLNSDTVRAYVLENYKMQIYECFRAFIKQKFSNNYAQFLIDRGEQTHIDDIPTLTMRNTIEVK